MEDRSAKKNILAQQQAEKTEDRNYLMQQRQQEQQKLQQAADEKEDKDRYTLFKHIPLDAPDEQFLQEFDKGFAWQTGENPTNDPEELAERQRIMSMSPQEKRMMVQQGRNHYGIDPKPGKQEGPYTLSPGQTRYDASGKPVATAPGAPDKLPILSQTGKLINEQKQYKEGTPEWQFYQNKLETEQMEPLSDGERTQLAQEYNVTGKLPFKGRGKWVMKSNAGIVREAVSQQKAQGRSGIDTALARGDAKAVQSSISAQEKSRGSMGSFVSNLGKQVDRVDELAGKLKTMDTRLLNMPINALRTRIAGDPELSKYRLYLGEITSEIGKLSSGSTGSVAELSQGAREHWEKVLDPNLSLADMQILLKEVKHAGDMRMESVDDTLKYSRSRLRDFTGSGSVTPEDRSKPLKFNMSTGGFE
jgi:hypothetical protein